jgi:hypothetical protein
MPVKKRVTRSVWVDPDDAPEWTQDQFDRAEIAIGGKVMRPAQGTLTRPRGWPKKADPEGPYPHPPVAAGARAFSRRWAGVADAHRRGAA